MYSTNISIALDHFTTFGDLLKYLRRRVGLTQRELSIAVGYSDTQISRLEQNQRMPDLATLTARFLPALDLEDQPDVARRLLELAATMRREDAPAVGLPPYKGLNFFDESDAELFFGRESLTKLLLKRVAECQESDHRFLAVIGASGSGKSSVIRAGLIPALSWQQPSSGWPVIILTPTAHPFEALASVLIKESRNNLPVGKLADQMARDPEILQDTLEKVALAAGAAHTILIVDQFEELFTLCRSHTEQTSYVENLIGTALSPTGKTMILIVMRADFYAHCAKFSSLRQLISQHQEYIGPMSNEELRCAIEYPARSGHWEFEPGLVDLLLHDIGADAGHNPEPGALPLLSQALLSTWQRRRGRMLTLSGYFSSGGVRSAIAETAEAVFYDRLGHAQREVARQIFLRLTELGGETSSADTRRRVKLEELISKPDDRDVVNEVLLTLADARLITTDQETVEVAHEALIREWPTLRRWLEEDREGLRLHRRLTEAAQDWDASSRDVGVLYRGARLAQAIEWSHEHPEIVNPLERSFLEASQALQDKEIKAREAQRQRELEAMKRLAEAEKARAEQESWARQRLRIRALILTIALVIAGAMSVTALIFWQRAVQANHLASSRELAAAAVNNLQIDPERSVLLALQALDEADTLEARNALHQAMPELHILQNINAHSGGVPDIAYSPDGARIASLGALGEIKVWDTNSGELIITLQGGVEEFGSSIAFSPDGNTLAAGLVTQVILFDLPSGEIRFTLSGKTVGTTYGYNLGVGQIKFSPDGNHLAVANMDGVPKIWDLTDQKEIMSLRGQTQPSKAIDYSSNATLLATAGDDGIVHVWDAGSGKEIFELSLGGIIHSLSFSPDATRIAAASEDGGVKIWDAVSGQETLSLPRQSGIYDLTFLSNEKIATAGQDGTARVWDAHSGQPILTLAGATSTVISIAGNPGGDRIATGAYDGSLRIWDAAPGRELLTIPAHENIIWNLAYTPDGSRIASASVDGFVKLWDVKTSQNITKLSRGNTPTDGFTGLAYSPDGMRLAAGSIDGSITIWDCQTENIVASLNGHSNMVVGLAFSPDGGRLASAGWDGVAKVWDINNAKEISSFSGTVKQALITNIVFSPDGEAVFTGIAEDHTVFQWDAFTGDVIREFSGDDKEIYGLAISPRGDILAAGNQDGKILFWDVKTGEMLRTSPGHAGLVLRLVFNHDGTLLASASHDRLAKVWDVRTGEELFSLYGNASNVFGVSFSPDGENLATAGADGTIRIFSMNFDNLIEQAYSRLTRGLTQEECQKFLHKGSCLDS